MKPLDITISAPFLSLNAPTDSAREAFVKGEPDRLHRSPAVDDQQLACRQGGSGRQIENGVDNVVRLGEPRNGEAGGSLVDLFLGHALS